MLRLGWRNLWRNRRRTWLTAGGVAFAVFLVVGTMCIQFGSYAAMEETATSLLTGHLQIQHRGYLDDARFERLVPDADRLLAAVAEVPGIVAAAPRVEAFVLASAGERSYGAQLLGIDPAAEARVVSFAQRITRGRGMAAPGDALLGEGLARNLGLAPGDEVVLLGTARQGGVAAMALTVAGLFRSGIAEVDRSLLLAPIDEVREAFDLNTAAHSVVVRTAHLGAVDRAAARVRDAVPARWGRDGDTPIAVRPWHELLPELRQAIEVDRISGALFYWLVMILVTLSVVNAFIMTVFERTREYGMLLAVGLRPGRIMAMLQWEAALLWLLGAAAGLAAALLLVAVLSRTGIYLGAEMERLAAEMYMPARLYPTLTASALLTAPLVMLVGTQLAAVLPALRIRRLKAVEAMRVAE